MALLFNIFKGEDEKWHWNLEWAGPQAPDIPELDISHLPDRVFPILPDLPILPKLPGHPRIPGVSVTIAEGSRGYDTVQDCKDVIKYVVAAAPDTPIKVQGEI